MGPHYGVYRFRVSSILPSLSPYLLDFIRAFVAIAKVVKKKRKIRNCPAEPHRPPSHLHSGPESANFTSLFIPRVETCAHASRPAFTHHSLFLIPHVTLPLSYFYSVNKKISARFPINYSRNIRRGRRFPPRLLPGLSIWIAIKGRHPYTHSHGEIEKERRGTR